MELLHNPLKDLTPNGQLNETLEFLIKTKGTTSSKVSTHFYLPDAELVQKQYDYITELLVFLCDEGYAKREENTKPDRGIYTITFKGIQFLKNGGYTAHYKRQTARLIEAKIISWATASGAVVAALATSLYLIWTVYSFGVGNHYWYPAHWLSKFVKYILHLFS